MPDKSEAYLNGWLAHKEEKTSDDNPYNEQTQKYSNSQWLSGWCARFGAIKHGEELIYDTVEWDI